MKHLDTPLLLTLLTGCILATWPAPAGADEPLPQDQRLIHQSLAVKLAQTHPEKTPGPRQSADKAKAIPQEFLPPFGRGAPDRRSSGATRGGISSLPALFVLAPNNTDLTFHEQPTLYWYASVEVTHPVVLTLIEDDDMKPKPELEAQLTPPLPPGIHAIRLADYGIRLVARKRYRWSVSLMLNDMSPSKDVLARGTIQRIEKDPSLGHLKGDRDDHLARLVKAGLWYDAVMAISEQIEATPTNRELHRKRAVLLEQVQLEEVARYDRSPGR